MTTRAPLLLLVVLGACAPRSDAASAAGPQEVTFTATDFAFSGPDSIAPGLTTIRLVNQGAQDHHFILGRLDDGKTMAELGAFMQEHPGAEPPFLKWHGAANAIAGGATELGATIDLPAGDYVAICFLPDPTDGKDHASKGMVRTLRVGGASHSAAAPASEAEIRLRDFSFELPAITAGRHTFHVINDGPQTHEMQVIRLNDGATAQDYMAAMAPGAKGPPPGVMVGGPGAFSAGLGGYWTMDFTPGNYLLVCFVPDPGSGAPHVMKGMSRELTVAAT